MSCHRKRVCIQQLPLLLKRGVPRQAPDTVGPSLSAPCFRPYPPPSPEPPPLGWTRWRWDSCRLLFRRWWRSDHAPAERFAASKRGYKEAREISWQLLIISLSRLQQRFQWYNWYTNTWIDTMLLMIRLEILSLTGSARTRNLQHQVPKHTLDNSLLNMPISLPIGWGSAYW